MLDKDKILSGLGTAMDKVNETADKAAQYAKEKEWDVKAQNAKKKTCEFVREHEIDKKTETVVGVLGAGLRKAGEGLEKAGSSIENSMKEKQKERDHKDWYQEENKNQSAEEGTWRQAEEEE